MLPDVGEPVIGHRDPQPGQRREPAFDFFERLVDWFFPKVGIPNLEINSSFAVSLASFFESL